MMILIKKKMGFENLGYYFIGVLLLVIMGFWFFYFVKFIDRMVDFMFYFYFYVVMVMFWLVFLIV